MCRVLCVMCYVLCVMCRVLCVMCYVLCGHEIIVRVGLYGMRCMMRCMGV
jgi:hypothetical protein